MSSSALRLSPSERVAPRRLRLALTAMSLLTTLIVTPTAAWAAPPPPLAAPAASTWRPWDGDTMAWQLLGGTAGGVVGGFAGLALVAGYLRLTDSGGGWDALAFGLLGGFGGVMIGTGVGTWWTGNFTGGNGGLGWSLLGSAGGTASGLALGAAANAGSAVLFVGLLGGVAGGVVGYHLSANPAAPSPVSAAVRFGSDGSVLMGVPLATPLQDAGGRLNGWQLSLVSGRF